MQRIIQTFLWRFMFLVIFCAISIPIQAKTPIATQTVILNLHLDEQGVSLNRMHIKPMRFFPLRGASNPEKIGDLSFEVRDEKGHLRYRGSVDDPRVIHYDALDDPKDLLLSGGEMRLSQTDFWVKIPFWGEALTVDFFEIDSEGKPGVRSTIHVSATDGQEGGR